jgi:hypothetical protein
MKETNEWYVNTALLELAVEFQRRARKLECAAAFGAMGIEAQVHAASPQRPRSGRRLFRTARGAIVAR